MASAMFPLCFERKALQAAAVLARADICRATDSEQPGCERPAEIRESEEKEYVGNYCDLENGL